MKNKNYDVIIIGAEAPTASSAAPIWPGPASRLPLWSAGMKPAAASTRSSLPDLNTIRTPSIT